MLTHLGFPTPFITLVMNCVSSPMLSFSLNGKMEGYFKSARGLRSQGDIMSPLLFVVCMDLQNIEPYECTASISFSS